MIRKLINLLMVSNNKPLNCCLQDKDKVDLLELSKCYRDDCTRTLNTKNSKRIELIGEQQFVLSTFFDANFVSKV